MFSQACLSSLDFSMSAINMTVFPKPIADNALIEIKKDSPKCEEERTGTKIY
jgi:hypothetical protein